MSDKLNKNPYLDPSGQPTMKKSVVVFLDILGYSDLIKYPRTDKENAQLLTHLHNALTESRRNIDPGETSFNHDEKDLYAMRSFTDNIVIGYPIRGDAEAELGSIFIKLPYFQMDMALNGYFIRGGISIGNLYIDDLTVFGPGLIEAYEGEVNLARDPRIILTETSLAAVDEHLSYYGRRNHAPQNYSLLKDSDGQVFINYLETLISEEGGYFSDELLKHKENTEIKLSHFHKNPKIWSKYFWVANYHNFFCETYLDIDKTYKINLDDFSPKPTRLIE